MAAVLKQWNGSIWVPKPLKYWNGSTWVTKQLKYWNGSAWIGASAGITAPAFRSLTNTTYAARNPTDLAKPAGVVANDILLAAIVFGSGTMPVDLTPASGFTQIGTFTAVNDAGFSAKMGLWWKRAGGSEPASYSFTHVATYSTQGLMMAFSGCPAAGSPVDASSQNSATLGAYTGTTATGTGVTTSQANDLLVYAGHNWDGNGALSPPAGMTERFDILVYAADQVIAAAGATGNRTQTLATTNPWAAFLVALKGT